MALEAQGAAASLYLGDENAPTGGQWPMAYMNSYGIDHCRRHLGSAAQYSW